MVACGAIIAQAIWIDTAIVERARAATAQMSSPRGQPGPGDPVDYYVDFDGYYYVAFAQQVARGEGPRIRWTRLDNTPDGRPVHWSSAFVWWLVGVGWLDSGLSDVSLAQAIPQAAYYANPLLFAIALALCALAVWRRLGGVPAALLALTLASHPILLQDFGYAKPDHHGLLIAFTLGLSLCAAIGAKGVTGSDARSLRRARNWMIASGVSGGLGLWAGATQTGVIIAGVGLGAATVSWRASGPDAHPELWRTWAWAGGVTSLAAFAVESIPGGEAMRLEVNHPLHALSWICAGQLISQLGAWRQRRPVLSLRRLAALAFAVAGVVLLPIAVAFGPVDWFWPKDAYMLRLHERITEFAPFAVSFPSAFAACVALGIPGLGVLGATGWLWNARRLPIGETAAVWVVVAPCWLLLPWLVAQTRWLGLFCAAGACVVAVLSEIACQRQQQRGARRVWIGLLAAIAGISLLLIGSIGARLTRSALESARSAPVALALDVFLRDVAANLCPPDPHRGAIRVMTGPSEAARLHHFGRCRAVGSPFWENLEGVRAMADFFAASDAEQGRQIARARALDFVLIANSVPFVEYMDLIRHGTLDPARASKTLGHRLIAGDPPEWLTPIGLRDWPSAGNWRLFRVEPE